MEKLASKYNMETLEEFGTNLTNMAKEDKLDPVIGRQEQIERVIQILCKRRKNNPCLIGEPGVGKTVIAEGLAQRIVKVEAPKKLHKKMVISIDMGRLIAGASSRGEFEGRLVKVIDEVKGSNGDIILFIDEVHTVIGAGGGSEALDAANILKPALARGELKCIGATTLGEFKKHIEKDSAMERRFQPVQVPEPSVVETIQILQGLRVRYENHHNVRYAEEALVSAAKLSKQYVSNRFLPDKAIDLIDEAGSRVYLRQTSESGPSPIVTEMDIQHLVSSWTGIPLEKLSSEDSERLLNMENILQKHVIGQEAAVTSICRAIRRARVGIRDPNRPIASLLFTGPSGVGKTELAKVLAAEYFGSKEAMIRLDMSEYYDRHTVSKLIGSPPGYIGHDNGGQLTDAIRRRPHTVILFDEIEKAHSDVFNTMLQIMDDGRLTDGKGRTVDFKNTVLIMTSNIGSSVVGKGDDQTRVDQVNVKVGDELKKLFRPEFLNRLDEVIIFRGLTKLEIRQIVDIMLNDVSERLKEREIKLEITRRFKDMVAEEGYCPIYGARPLRRTIVRLLEDSLANSMLNGNINEGSSVTADINSDGDVVVYNNCHV